MVKLNVLAILLVFAVLTADAGGRLGRVQVVLASMQAANLIVTFALEWRKASRLDE